MEFGRQVFYGDCRVKEDISRRVRVPDRQEMHTDGNVGEGAGLELLRVRLTRNNKKEDGDSSSNERAQR